MNKQMFRVGAHAAVAPMHQISQVRKDSQALTRAEADVVEAQRRIERQIMLIGELAERGESVLEPERALARLETKMAETRHRHRLLLGKLPGDAEARLPDPAMQDRATELSTTSGSRID